MKQIVTIKERLAILETKQQLVLYLVAANLGMRGVEWVWPPILEIFSILIT